MNRTMPSEKIRRGVNTITRGAADENQRAERQHVALTTHRDPRNDVPRSPCTASATPTTEPSMNAILEARMVAARIQGLALSAHWPGRPGWREEAASSLAVRTRPTTSLRDQH